MAGELNAYAVLDIAERMERDAARFYRKAAGICDDPKLCKLFADLAQWERRHLELFAEMRERLSAQSVESWHPALKEIQRQVMKPPVFEESDDLSKELSGCTRTDVLEMAIGKEKDAIAYYTSLAGFMPGHGDSQVIESIIREEERHVRILTQSLEQTS
jgi:rubrerythrin